MGGVMSAQIILGIEDLFPQLLGVLSCQSFTRIVPFEDDYNSQGHGFFLGAACIQWLIYEELGRPEPLASAACLNSGPLWKVSSSRALHGVDGGLCWAFTSVQLLPLPLPHIPASFPSFSIGIDSWSTSCLLVSEFASHRPNLWLHKC